MLASNQAGVLELMSARQVGALATTLLAAAVVWPVAVVRARQWSMEVAHLGPSSLSVDVRARSRARLMGAVPMVAVAVVTAAVAGVAAREYGVASNVLIAVLAATGMLATLSFLLLRYLIGTLVGPRRRTSLALIATLAATCVAVAFPLFIYVYDDWYNRIRLAAFLLAASILITAYALFAAWATVFVAARRIARRWSTALAAVVVLVILVLAVPDTIALAAAPAPTWEAGLWSLLWLASALGAVSGVLLVACLLLALKRLSGRAESGKGSEIIRQGGVVFAVVTFYWWGERWLYVPITLLLGWLVAAKVALPRDRASTQTDGFINRAVQLQGRVNAGQAAPAASDASPQQDPRAAVERTAFGQQPASINGVQPATAFASGDDEQASYLRRRLRGGGWRHGRQAALWGLLLGLPSSALYLWQIGTAPVDPSDYEALDFLVGTASWIVLQWAIFGFFFGYFYPYLRGGSGIPKALSLFALVILPPLLYHALWSQLEAWRAYGFFALQMFVFTMLLGLLAGDYLLLQRVNMGWQQFRDVHNLRVVLTWGSSVAVALGGIITTLLTTSASEVVSALLEQAGIGGGGAGPPGPQSR